LTVAIASIPFYFLSVSLLKNDGLDFAKPSPPVESVEMISVTKISFCLKNKHLLSVTFGGLAVIAAFATVDP
jgi:hypothetical protein